MCCRVVGQQAAVATQTRYSFASFLLVSPLAVFSSVSRWLLCEHHRLAIVVLSKKLSVRITWQWKWVSVISPCFYIRWQQRVGNLAGPTFGNQVKILTGRLQEEEVCFPPKGISCFAHRYLLSVETKLVVGCDMSTTIDRPEDASAAVAPLYTDEMP